MEDVNTQGYIFIFLPKPSCLIIKLPFISQNMPASKEITPAQSIDDVLFPLCRLWYDRIVFIWTGYVLNN